MTWISQESSLTNARPPHVDRDTVSPSPEMVSASGCVVEPVRFVTYKVAARREPEGVAALKTHGATVVRTTGCALSCSRWVGVKKK